MSNKYGNDLILFNGDLAISARGDLSTSTDYEKTQSVPFAGYYNIIFSVFNRINTIVGELPIHPEYGSKLPLLVSTPGKQEFVDNLRNEINDALLQDQRISQVITSEVNISGSFVSVKSEVVLTGRADSSVFIFPNFYIE